MLTDDKKGKKIEINLTEFYIINNFNNTFFMTTNYTQSYFIFPLKNIFHPFQSLFSLYNSERRFLMYFPHVIVFFIYLFLLEKNLNYL